MSLGTKCTCGHSRGAHAEDNSHTCMVDFCQCNMFRAVTNDPVKSPSHYQGAGMEAWDVVEAFDLGYHLGNAFKYISRAGKKNAESEEQDLRKAIAFIERKIVTINRKGSK